MITMDGALWQKMRAIQQPAFHPDALAEYVPHFFAAIDRRLDRWRSIDPDTPLDIGAETWALAVDMISRALFDRDTPHNPYFVYKAVEVFTTVGNHHPSPRRPSEGQATDELTLEQAIAAWGAPPEQVLAAPALESRERTLLRLIEAAAVDPEAGEFDVAQVMDEIKQYIWAGTETTALVLGRAIYLTATRPDVAERVRLEAERVFAHEEPNLAAYERLSYTRKVIAETMRMYPPIWSLARRAESEDVLGGQAVKTGDVVLLWTYAVHHDPRHWSEPTRFDPERFDERAKAPAAYTYLPFGAGKRACIGTTMSQIEMALALSLMIREFEFEFAGEGPPEIKLSVVLSSNNGLPMRIRRRAKARFTGVELGEPAHAS